MRSNVARLQLASAFLRYHCLEEAREVLPRDEPFHAGSNHDGSRPGGTVYHVQVYRVLAANVFESL